MTVKMLGLISSCDECPHKSYYSGGRNWCVKAQAVLPFRMRGNPLPSIPDWCPLPDYPAAMIQRDRDKAMTE